MKTWLAAIALMSGVGCEAYVGTQVALVEQSRRGLELVGEAQAQRAAMVEELHELRRRRLDEAFAADVVGREELTAEWVLEHGRVYGAAVDALAERRAASREATRVAEENLRAVDAALVRLRWLQELQMGWLDLSTEERQ